MGRRGPKPRYQAPADVILRAFDLPPFRRKRQRRRPDSCLLVDDALGLGADWFPAYMIRPITMPRGGYRWQVRCPACERWVLRLYSPEGYGPTYRGNQWRCRHCWHLHYPSEYAGRRPTASRERMAAMLESIWKAHSEETRERRAERFLDTLAEMQRREAAWIVRFVASQSTWMGALARKAGME